MSRIVMAVAALGVFLLSALAQAQPIPADLLKEAAKLRDQAARSTNPAEKRELNEKAEALQRAAEATTAPNDLVRQAEAANRVKREALEAERRRLTTDLQEIEANLKILRANHEKRKAGDNREETERQIAEVNAALGKLEVRRVEIEEIEKQLESLALPKAATIPRRFSADERFRQRLAEFSRSVAKLRADGNEAAALRAEAEANEFARQQGERSRVELEVMRSQAEQLRSSGRATEAGQIEKAIQARTDALDAAERAQAEFRPAPSDNPSRPRPATNVDGLSREAIVRRIAHFRQAQEHLQEVGRGELVEQLQREIDRLENRLAADAATPPPAAPEISRLQAENEQLKKDVASLKEAVDRLTDALKRLTAPRGPQ